MIYLLQYLLYEIVYTFYPVFYICLQSGYLYLFVLFFSSVKYEVPDLSSSDIFQGFHVVIAALVLLHMCLEIFQQESRLGLPSFPYITAIA